MSYIIETKTFEHEGFTITIDVVPDPDTTPYNAEFYSVADIAAWGRDEWFFVAYVYKASREGVTLGTAAIWGSEWDFPGTESSIDEWIAQDFYHPDLLKEAVADARATLKRLGGAGVKKISDAAHARAERIAEAVAKTYHESLYYAVRSAAFEGAFQALTEKEED